jgi:hypothetical protein
MRAELTQLYFGKLEHLVSEAEVIETCYSEQELGASSELRSRYESAKEDQAVAELVTLMYFFKDNSFAEAAAKYAPLREQIKEAIKAEELSETFTPAECIIWARNNDIAVPGEIRRAIEEQYRIPDWKTRCDELSNECIVLKRERDEAQAALEEKKRHDQLNPKGRTTLLRALYGLAQLHYGHDHRIPGKPTAKDISGDLDPLGINIHADTIRDWLAKAVEELPDNWVRDNPLASDD